MRSVKADTNAKWTSSHEYRTNYESIFKGKDMKRAIDFFEDGFRRFQSEAKRNPKFAFCHPTMLACLSDAWMMMPGSDGAINIYGVKVTAREDHDDNGITFG
jgi:hypothetical protein